MPSGIPNPVCGSRLVARTVRIRKPLYCNRARGSTPPRARGLRGSSPLPSPSRHGSRPRDRRPPRSACLRLLPAPATSPCASSCLTSPSFSSVVLRSSASLPAPARHPASPPSCCTRCFQSGVRRSVRLWLRRGFHPPAFATSPYVSSGPPPPSLALECNILPHLPRRRGRRGFRGHARQGPDPARPRGAYPATVAGSDHEVATKSQEDARGGSRLPVHRGYPSGRTSSRSLAASPARMREAVTLAPSSRHWR